MPQMQPEPERLAQRARLEVTSTAFQHGQSIPAQFTGDGDDVSPPLKWSSPPPGTKSFALVCEDPDAPSGLFVHWLAWNLPASLRELKEGILPDERDLRQGTNGFGEVGYGGPMPPPGKAHRYVFRVYALDTTLDLPAGASRREFDQALFNHVLGEGVLVGKYAR